MPTITQDITDIAGVPDNATWRFSSTLRDQDGTIITTRKVSVTPVNGVLTVVLEPGPALVTVKNQTYAFTVPSGNSDLWSLIAAAIAVPPNTSAQALAAAITAFFDTVDNGDGTATV